jgi:hypothetical protein
VPTFETKSKSELRDAGVKAELYSGYEAPQPGDKVPQASDEHLRPLGANEFYPRFWQYLHDEHTFSDFSKPGYFADEAREHLRVGDTIVYTLCGGSKLPSDWERGIAVVQEVPNSKELPVILAGVVEYPKPAVWRGEPKSHAA